MPHRLQHDIDKRKEEGGLREIFPSGSSVDFTSNDYLGVVRSGKLSEMLADQKFQSGTGGSRLLSGTKNYHLNAEKELADFFKAETAVLFNSGYTANLGLLSSILKRGDEVIYDDLSHASIKDGIRLGLARAAKFLHNDLNDLRSKLERASSGAYVVVESVYSMDGDLAPLKEMAALCEEFGAFLIVDEAHSTGIYGPRGAGLVVAEGLEQKVFARIHTFGKAMGCQGAVVVGSKLLKEYLINFSRPFIYTTAPAEHEVQTMLSSLKVVALAEKERELLQRAVGTFRTLAAGSNLNLLDSKTQIQGIEIPGNEQVKRIADQLRNLGFDIRPIRKPTVPEGRERIRICLHAFNGEEELKKLVKSINDLINE